MNYPTFSKTGDISMHEVIDAKISDFIPEVGKEFVVNELRDFINFLKTCEPYCGDCHWNSKGYDKMFSDYIHAKLGQYETNEGHNRTPDYTHSPKYCFWYNVFCKMIHSYPYHHCSEKESREYHIERLENMLDI